MSDLPADTPVTGLGDTRSASEWSLAKEILADALERPAEERDAFVVERCGADAELLRRVRDFLRYDATDGTEPDPLEPVAEEALGLFLDQTSAAAEAAARPERIGQYLLEDEIGRGGMGVVYLARRAEDFEQRVAIKVVGSSFFGRAGDPSWVSEEHRRRFENERRLLARLDHPHIARLIDGGTLPDGRPYMVMDHVDGLRIDEHCRTHELPVAARVDLVVQVCRAVQVAHRNLIIHRDLKPGNILVTRDGEPRLLDFGIAKLIEPGGDVLTLAGRGPLTPRYASPEQLRGEVLTTASDVYSLGVVLRDLVTTVDHAESEGTTDTERRAHVDPDLAAVLTQATEDELADRYATVEALADDLERWRGGLPVRARPVGPWARLAKLVRRHPLTSGVATLAALLILALGAATLLQSRRLAHEVVRADSERQAALEAGDDLRAMNDFLVDLFDAEGLRASRIEPERLASFLEYGAATTDQRFTSRPLLRAALHTLLGRAYFQLGRYDESLAQHRLALDVRRENLSADDPALAESLGELAAVHLRVGDMETAEGELATALERLGARSDDEPALTASLLVTRGMLRASTGQREEAFVDVERAHGLRRELLGEDHPALAETLRLQGFYGRHLGDDARHRLFERAVQVIEDAFGPHHPELVESLVRLAGFSLYRGELDLARAQAERAAEIAEPALGDHPQTARALKTLATVADQQGDLDVAALALEKAARIEETTLGVDHPDRASTLEVQAKVLSQQGRGTEAEELLRWVLEVRERQFGADAYLVGMTLTNLGHLRQAAGDCDEAVDLFRRAVTILEAQRRGATDFQAAGPLHGWGQCDAQRGATVAAARRFQDALDLMDEAGVAADHFARLQVAADLERIRPAIDGPAE